MTHVNIFFVFITMLKAEFVILALRSPRRIADPLLNWRKEYCLPKEDALMCKGTELRSMRIRLKNILPHIVCKHINLYDGFNGHILHLIFSLWNTNSRSKLNIC